jgi:hypothetical protein
MKKTFLLILVLFSSLIKTFAQAKEGVIGVWDGTARVVEKFTGAIAGTSERYIDVTIQQNKVTGSHKYSADITIGGQHWHDECAGTGPGELITLNIRPWDGTYDIGINSPECKLISGGGNSGTGGTTIDIPNQKLQLKGNQFDVTELSGTLIDGKTTEGLGKYTVTTTWHLVRSIDLELIVTPEGYDKEGNKKNYDDWLPEPGKDEISKGSVMKVRLRLQTRSGKPLQYKAQSFELRLSNTSREPGITINYPTQPQPKHLPDLRFIPLPIAESDDEDQYITVTSKDGITGEAFIASYDGGGATILTAEANVDGETPVKGQLLVSGGDENIQIPKRTPGTMIATAWLIANGNPGEGDDMEMTKGNYHNGDGFTAYEEYRGVISEGKFKRLNPKKKEVGILATKKDFSIFNEGITWFKDASYLEPVRFDYDKDEVSPSGQINFNNKSIHDFDQFAIYLTNGGLGSNNGTLGATYCNDPLWIPPNIKGVVIDWNKIQRAYQRRINEARPEAIKFTLREYLAQTVAHELGHAVNIDHHGTAGNQGPFSYDVTDVSKVRIFDRNGKLITNSNLNFVIINNHFTLENVGYPNGTVEGGDMSCMLNYYPYYSWGFTVGVDGAHIFNQEPLLPLGRKFCTSKAGTGINATGLYFGEAAIGNCLGYIQLRN